MTKDSPGMLRIVQPTAIDLASAERFLDWCYQALAFADQPSAEQVRKVRDALFSQSMAITNTLCPANKPARNESCGVCG